jgi:hypothetical protein
VTSLAIPQVSARAWLTWRVVYVLLNAPLIGFAVLYNLGPAGSPDFEIWRQLPDRLRDGTLYDGLFRWSPVAAYPMALVGIAGPVAWAGLHVAALALLRDWRLALLVVASWGFWTDLTAGNAFTFILVAAVLAWRGSRAWSLVYLGLLLLIPRPIQIPLALWLLWQRPDLRLPFAAIFTVHALAVLISGYGPDWIYRLVATGGPEMGLPFPLNSAPSAFIGWWWMLIGLPLGAWLLWKGRPGWAGLAVSPYWLPYYLLMPLLEITTDSRRRDHRADSRCRSRRSSTSNPS